MKNIKMYILSSMLLGISLMGELSAQSSVYVGGHFRRERPNTVTTLKSSGFDCVILFNVNVETDGTLTTDGDTICFQGNYVFAKKHPYYISDVNRITSYNVCYTKLLRMIKLLLRTASSIVPATWASQPRSSITSRAK